MPSTGTAFLPRPSAPKPARVLVMMMVKVVLMEIIMINRKMMFSMHEEEGSHIDIKST